ncbi:Uncharacterized protein APZ42_006387 [Daphnia magna]|uniref:Reverse transcriptase domain-containing protein n=1 Tax=Daphnia magna TaxID=35525 RepID=A0A164FXF6_9CRUS|nr:Uncharacterized protein APZ42_006387 [Daphnia magna]
MERLINNRLQWYIDKHIHLPKAQIGFRKECTTLDNITRLETDIQQDFNVKKSTTAIFLDIETAYDNTWITGLMYKITKLNINGKTLKWINNFLGDRIITVKVNNSTSEKRRLTKGVPQGYVLSPLLFNIMMADFPIQDKECKVSLFADDIEIHTTTEKNCDVERYLQGYLNKIETWAKHWRMKFSATKCMLVHFSRKKSQERNINLTLNNVQLKETNNYKFLGVIFDHKLTWENHINLLSASLTHSHNLIKMLTYGKTTLKLPLLVKIYNAMTRSKLNYGALALSSIPRSKLQKLEIKQNQILKTI